MANQEQVKILEQGVDVWNKWREDNPNTWIDLGGAQLLGANLSGVNLSGVILSSSNLGRTDLSEANLQEAILLGAYLSEAKLREANLRKAHLNNAILLHADLRKANLQEANLEEVVLEIAHLGNADLRNAMLGSANLSYAILDQADLRGAGFIGTMFNNASLTGANFLNSALSGATFGENDLSEALGLTGIRHLGTSTIGTNTIRKSKGKIPVEFLRGCGLSDLEIESAKLATPGLDSEQVMQIAYEIHHIYCEQPIQFYSCFISYNSKDQIFAQRLHDDLQNNGVRCWFAPEDMKIGDEFRKAIGQQIQLREKLLIILSENSIRSEWVGDEVEKALAEEKEQGTLKLFPIRLDNAIFEARDDWAEKIRLRRHIGNFSDDYVKAFQRLLKDLKSQ